LTVSTRRRSKTRRRVMSKARTELVPRATLDAPSARSEDSRIPLAVELSMLADTGLLSMLRRIDRQAKELHA